MDSAHSVTLFMWHLWSLLWGYVLRGISQALLPDSHGLCGSWWDLCQEQRHQASGGRVLGRSQVSLGLSFLVCRRVVMLSYLAY